MRRLLVTGADGFVGRVLVEKALQHGHHVTAAVRRSWSGDPSPRLRVALVGDIGSFSGWESSMRDVDTVIHLAGRAHVAHGERAESSNEFERVNCEGTTRLAECAARADARRFVFASSIKVSGERTGADGAAGLRETDPAQPGDSYARSKWNAERALVEVSDRSRMQYAIVRPPLVYGAGVKANFLSLMRWVDWGLPLPLGAVRNRRSLISVWNLADLLLECARHESARDQLFLAADDSAVSTADLVSLLARELGRRPRLLSVRPAHLGTLGRLIGRSEQIARLCDSLVVDARKARELLGWRPALSIEEAIRRTVLWYRLVEPSGPLWRRFGKERRRS